MASGKSQRARVCVDCGKQEMVRQDNSAVRCKPCGARKGVKSASSVEAAKRRRRRIKLTCSHCSVEFERSLGQAKGTKQPYCSMKCKQEHHSVERECDFCSTKFRLAKSLTEDGPSNSAGRFCSRACYNSWMCRGGRVTGRGSQWKTTRDEVVNDAPFCGRCGSILKQLQVHHIVPYRLTHDNARKNLIPLCVKCHKKVEMVTVEAEATGVTPDELGEVMNIILRFQQIATFNYIEKHRHGC